MSKVCVNKHFFWFFFQVFQFILEKDPEFFFTKKLASSVQGFTNRSVTFSCALNQSGASVKWKRNGSPINVSYTKFY